VKGIFFTSTITQHPATKSEQILSIVFS